MLWLQTNPCPQSRLGVGGWDEGEELNPWGAGSERQNPVSLRLRQKSSGDL